MLRHVVIWSMAEGHEDELDDVLRELRELPGQIEEIAGLSAGRLLNDSELDYIWPLVSKERTGAERPMVPVEGGRAPELTFACETSRRTQETAKPTAVRKSPRGAGAIGQGPCPYGVQPCR